MKKAMIHIAQATCMAALALSAGMLLAQPSGGDGGAGGGEHRKPPQEALDACKSLKAGQDCNFTSPRGAVKGTCYAPEGKPLACKPKNAPTGSPPSAKQ